MLYPDHAGWQFIMVLSFVYTPCRDARNQLQAGISRPLRWHMLLKFQVRIL